MKGIDKHTKKAITTIINLNTFDFVGSPGFGNAVFEHSYEWERLIKLKERRNKINKILRKQKIKYLLYKHGGK